MTRLTAAFMKENIVAFFPASKGEAVYIQQRLVTMGIRWQDGSKICAPQELVDRGLIVYKGVMYTGNADIYNEYVVAGVRDLSPCVESALEQRLRELEAQVAGLQEQLTPRTLGLGAKRPKR